MKKICTNILIISLICALLSMIICFITLKFNKFDYPGFELSNRVLNEVNSSPDAPGSGEYLMIAGSMAFGLDVIGVLGVMLVYAFILFIAPLVAEFLTILFILIARLVQIGDVKKSKNTASKVLIYIGIVFQALLSIWFLISIFMKLEVYNILLIINCILNIICIIFILKKLNSYKDEPEEVNE